MVGGLEWDRVTKDFYDIVEHIHFHENAVRAYKLPVVWVGNSEANDMVVVIANSALYLQALGCLIKRHDVECCS